MKSLTGTVITQKFGAGSKSEHNAVFLDTGNDKYRIKKRGGNPFFDNSLQKYIGKTIKVKGNITPYFFEIVQEPEIVK